MSNLLDSNRIVLNRKEINKVREFISAAYPDYASYKGFKVTLDFNDKPVNLESYWDSGYKDYFAIVGVDGTVRQVPENGGMMSNVKVAPWQRNPRQAVVNKTRISAKTFITIYFHPDLKPKMLAATAGV